MMHSATRLLLPLAAAVSFAAPALAESVRTPIDGAPAIVVDMQDGWTKNYDDMGNLTFFADDRSGGLLFRMIEAGPGEATPANSQLAEIILIAAGAQPPGPGKPTTFAGGEAESFTSTLTADGVPPITLNVVIRKVGDRHIAVGVTMIPEATDAAGRKKVEAQFARVTITTR
ncbi:MAG: hypothetical protein ACK4YM_05835 [Novosphingobium sp.]